MTSGAIFVVLIQCIGVGIVQEGYRRFLQRTEGPHRIDLDDVRSQLAAAVLRDDSGFHLNTLKS